MIIFELEGFVVKVHDAQGLNNLSFPGSFPLSLSSFTASESPSFCMGRGAACWTM